MCEGKLEITSKDFEVTQSIREHIDSRLSKLGRFDIDIFNTHLVLEQERNNFKIDAVIKIAQKTIIAQSKHTDLYVAINDLGKKIERQFLKVAKIRNKNRYKDGLVMKIDDDAISQDSLD